MSVGKTTLVNALKELEQFKDSSVNANLRLSTEGLAKPVKDVPVNKRAYILYHMAKQNIYDPEFFA